MMEKIKKHLVLSSMLLSLILGVLIAGVSMLFTTALRYENDVWDITRLLYAFLIRWLIWSVFIIYPFILTINNLVFLFVRPKDKKILRSGKMFEYLTLVLGVSYSIPLILVTDIIFSADWTDVLVNNQKHSPIWTQSYPTIAIVLAVALIGYLILSSIRVEKMPPLVIVCSMAAMYLGAIECLLWIVQIFFRDASFLFVSLLPFNWLVITAKTVRYKILEWNEVEEPKTADYEGKPILAFLNAKFNQAACWPVLALILMLPLLGIIMCILVLFGQRPDYFIKAWIETSDWNLSAQTAPPNVMHDEHYLCTVAAGGHKEIVKPIRMGERHGHRVVVNRQLCIANAFEQILEERTPGFHKRIRHFYDTYGFPIARLIRSRFAADVVYVLMKPLEWIFLVVIYFCDVKPENRIAVQYLPKLQN